VVQTLRWWQVLAGGALVALAGAGSTRLELGPIGLVSALVGSGVVTLAALRAVAGRGRRSDDDVVISELVVVDLREPVSPVVTRPVVLRRTLVSFDPFDPPPAAPRHRDAVVAAPGRPVLDPSEVTGTLGWNLPSPS
jgi:hypothetical protein